MAPMKTISILGKVALVITHSLALILISWYFLIWLGVVQYDAADQAGALLLLSLPVSLILLIVLGAEWLHSGRNRPIIAGLAVSGLIALVSGIAWVQLMLFFSSFSGTTFG